MRSMKLHILSLSVAIAAFVAAGIRVPEDVRVATWANRGNGPFYAK